MSFINLFKTSIASIKSHKLRVFLTMIGIIIGISSVVTILSIGDGLKAHVNKSLEKSDANKITVSFNSKNEDVNLSLVEAFSDSDLTLIKDLDSVDKVEPSKTVIPGFNFSTSDVTFFDKSSMIFLEGYQDATYEVAFGRKFNPDEEDKRLIILDYNAAKALFNDPSDGIGRGVTIDSVGYEVIGILNKTELFSMSGNSSYISKNFINTESDQNSAINSIDVLIKPEYTDKKAVFEDIKTILLKSHSDLEGDYELQDPNEITKIFENIIGGLTAFIALVSSISLFVGGIGVMNIMYVSVSERKREIGIRRAIGAKPKSIMLQFLLEAILVTCSGGLLGILFGFIFAKLIGLALPFAPILTIKNFIGSTITSIIVGIVFGIIPARNAANLDPIKAIYK